MGDLSVSVVENRESGIGKKGVISENKERREPRRQGNQRNACTIHDFLRGVKLPVRESRGSREP
jgi:hypothetical protein